MGEFLDLVTPKIFFQRLSDHIQLLPRKTERVAFFESLHRILAQDVIAPLDLPLFTRSTVDGFAVRSQDTAGVSETLPGYLEVSGEIVMGEVADVELQPGQGVKIPTGGMLPKGADAVMMVEYTEYLDETTIECTRAVAVGENLVWKGEDIQQGEILLSAGQRIRPQDLGALAGLGITEVEVMRQPEVVVVSTGDELVPPGVTPKPGQIYDINTYSLGGYLLSMGCGLREMRIVEDSFDQLQAVVQQNLDADLILISGGSSVGVKDMTVDVLNSLGEPGVIVHGVSVKPGKPTILAVVDQLPIIGLPGHPASAWTIFHLLVRPVIQVLKGEMSQDQLLSREWRGQIIGTLTRNLSSDRGKEQYIPVRVDWDHKKGYLVEPLLGKSSLITTLVQADGLIRIDTYQEGLNQGTEVAVEVFDFTKEGA